MIHIFLLTALGYVREIAEIVVLGFVVAGVINAVVNKEAVARYLGGSLILSNLLGATIGVVTPLCCCAAIPTVMALYRAGSRRGPACAFLIATPRFNWYGLAALVVAGLFSADSLGTLPWVQSLLAKGLGAGSAMTLLVAGVGANISTLGPVARVMGRQTAVPYALCVVGLIAVVGLTLNPTI